MLPKEELLLILYFTLVIFLLCGFSIVFFIAFQKRKNKILLEKFEAEKRFENELAQSQIEIQEQTLKNVGMELHDNIGQLLSVASLQLNILSRVSENENKESVTQIKEIVSNSLQEVRALSKSLNKEVIEYAGLESSVRNELSRFERLKILKTSFHSEGEKVEIPQKDTIILFRILQEFFSNVLKHAKAEKLTVQFNYSANQLKIEVHDNGKGFNVEEVQKNSGLINMKSRASLINTGFALNSAKNKGTSLSLTYPIKNPAL